MIFTIADPKRTPAAPQEKNSLTQGYSPGIVIPTPKSEPNLQSSFVFPNANGIGGTKGANEAAEKAKPAAGNIPEIY